MANNWENSNQVLQAICPTNALKLDDMNQPSVMVFYPRVPAVRRPQHERHEHPPGIPPQRRAERRFLVRQV